MLFNTLSPFPNTSRHLTVILQHTFPHINQINVMFALCSEIMGAHREGLHAHSMYTVYFKRQAGLNC